MLLLRTPSLNSKGMHFQRDAVCCCFECGIACCGTLHENASDAYYKPFLFRAGMISVVPMVLSHIVEAQRHASVLWHAYALLYTYIYIYQASYSFWDNICHDVAVEVLFDFVDGNGHKKTSMYSHMGSLFKLPK